MPTGGNSNSDLGQFGEEEEKLQQEKQAQLKDDFVADNEKGPDVMLCGSTSLATDPGSDPVTPTVYVSGPFIATTAADSVSDDTGSEDSRMNSDREPLLENQ